jgi:predicted RNA-binding protein associated with RNAse of E/G family
MREAIDYEIITIKEEDLFITIKKYNKMSDDFTLPNKKGDLIKYITEGYYVVELTPLKENYNIRFYVDTNKNIIDYYIDMTLENGEEYKMPYYIDLYLDITHYPGEDKLEFADEDELEEALNNNLISKDDYDLAYRVGNKLLEEIKNKKNKYMNIDIIKYINKFY